MHVIATNVDGVKKPIADATVIADRLLDGRALFRC